MANPYLAAVIATWRREKKKREAMAKTPRSRQSRDIWGPPMKTKKASATAPDNSGSPEA